MSNILSKINYDGTDLIIHDKILNDSKPINVLTLGIKNDGTTDCSELINKYTAEFPLYFPAGTYRIDAPLNIINGIYGAGYSQTGKDITTYIVPHFTSSDYAVVVGTSANNLEIKNISLLLNEGNNGFYIKSPHWTYMSDINICGVGSSTSKERCYGINCESTNSRQCCIDNVIILGTQYSVSTGIRMKSNDNRITNASIMFCQYGLAIDGCLCYCDNAHIWTGCNDYSKMPKELYLSTRAVCINNSPVSTFNNLYTDTSAVAISAVNSTVSITNLINWHSIPSSFAQTYGNMSCIFYAVDSYISVTGGSLYLPSIFYNGSNFNATDKNVRLTDVNFLIDNDISNYFGLANMKFSNQKDYIVRHPNNKDYCMVAAIDTNGLDRDQIAEITLDLNNNIECKITITKNTITLTHISGSTEWIYYTYNNYVIKIYAYFTSLECYVRAGTMTYDAFPVNITRLLDHTTRLPMLDGRTDSTGLNHLKVGANTITQTT